MHTKKKKLAVPNTFEITSLLKGLERDYEIIFGTAIECAGLLKKNKVDIAFISPLSYAMESFSEEYRILPEICLSGFQYSKSSILIFSPNKSSITNVAFRQNAFTELILTKILFSENYDLELKFIPSNEDIDSILKKYDSVLLTGKESLDNFDKYENKLILADEWYELTILPFVYGIWVVKEDVFSEVELNKFIHDINNNFADLSLQNIEKEVNENIEIEGGSEEILYYGNNYSFGKSQIDSLNEFFEMAFYYKVIEDIPELRFSDLIPQVE